MVDTYQSGQVLRWERSDTGTNMHTHMVVQSDLDLGLTFHHHPWQQHRDSPLSLAPAETGEQSLVERKPGDRRERPPDWEAVGRSEVKDSTDPLHDFPSFQ